MSQKYCLFYVKVFQTIIIIIDIAIDAQGKCP